MSSPTTTTPPADTGFDPMVFWIQHRTKIVLLAAVLVVGLITFAVSEYIRTRNNTAAEELFAKAESPDSLRKVIAEYPSTAAAGNAQLMLAAKLREEKKFGESTTTLRAFIEKHPEHQLISGAWTSIGANLEA